MSVQCSNSNMKQHGFVLLVASLVASVSCAVIERMYSSRSGSQDLEASASGYIYQSASGHPTSYVQFSSGGQPAAAPLQYYVARPQIQYPVPLQTQAYAQVEPQVAIQEESDHESLEEDEVEPQSYQSEEGDKSDDNDAYTTGEDEEYSSGGDEYNSASHSAHGEKGDKGYSNKHSFNKGEQGKHDNEQNKGYYKENGGHKQGHHSSSSNYGKHYEAGKGSKGENSGEAKYHKKGQKTTGFHNVYHKDEYKKDHTFYDEADNSGHYNKHGDYNAKHGSAEGGYKKDGQSEAAYQKDGYGKEGSHDKGHYVKEDAGFNGKKGHEAHHATYSDYAKDAGEKGGSEYGSNY